MTPGLERLSVHEFVRMELPLDRFLDGCASAGAGRVALLSANVEAFGVERAAARLRELAIDVSSYSSLGYWSTGCDHQGRRWGVDDNVRELDTAVRLGAPLVVLAPGPLDTAGKDLAGARRRVAEGILEIWPYAAERGLRLAVEPLHPLFCPDRSVVTSLRLALELVEPAPAGTVGLAVDSYHVWWDSDLGELLRRAGKRIFAVHVNDFVLPLPADRRRRGLMGEGCIDLAGFRRAVDELGFRGPYEVEVLNEELSALSPEDTVGRIVDSYRGFIS